MSRRWTVPVACVPIYSKMIDPLTPIVRLAMSGRVRAAAAWRTPAAIEKVQRQQLDYIVRQAKHTRWGSANVLNAVHAYESYVRQVPVATYEDFRPWVMRMVKGEKNILWPGVTTRFAQSSGTTGGKSKYIPITADSLRLNHYAGTRAVVAHYLHTHPHSRLFGGGAFILGGSYANELELPPGVNVGDLSATLIDCMPSMAAHWRVPSRQVALMADWREKLPALIRESMHRRITNISGVPSWFLTVLKGVIREAGASTIHDVWPDLEVFFHGGISFGPYRDEYRSITDPAKMHYFESYNASEGFFATQTDPSDPSMLLLLDAGVFYEFVEPADADNPMAVAVPAWEVQQGHVYALVITACNGLFRYSIGDTVRIESVAPLRISIVGRTKSYINVFGEEVMVHNTDRALTRACADHHCTAIDYTAGPVMPEGDRKGRHEWWIEWGTPPADIHAFERTLDRCLQDENSDYQAKRSGDLFLDCLQVHTAPAGAFDTLLSADGGRLGGQRKVPRLSNDRVIIDKLTNIKNQNQKQ